jgi:catechol 2,3-dioxygenase-like lactoylglutathione lyase family enzyme
VIDHVSIAVSDLTKATCFYEKLLATLGHDKLMMHERAVGFGKTYPEFWLNSRKNLTLAPANSGAHVALRARDRETVQKFHKTALANGATCDGPPGPREATNPGYYSAFIRDMDGNRIEAVTFLPDEDTPRV